MKFRVQVKSPTGLIITDEQEIDGADVSEVIEGYMAEDMQQIEMQMLVTCTDDED